VLVWTLVESDDDVHYRAVLEGYLVFLRLKPADFSRRKRKRSRGSGDWFVHFLMPDEEREKAFLAGEGFTVGASLERAQVLALEKAVALRGALERKAARR
jgi:hypothetical protein